MPSDLTIELKAEILSISLSGTEQEARPLFTWFLLQYTAALCPKRDR